MDIFGGYELRFVNVPSRTPWNKKATLEIFRKFAGEITIAAVKF